MIRRATAADLPQVRAIYNHYVTTSTVTFDEDEVDIEHWHDRLVSLEDAGLPFLVAESGAGEVLGYALVGPWRAKRAYRYTVENSIYLGQAATGRGIGTRLLAELIECCTEAGVRQIVAVIADEGAEASLTMHRAFGFTEVGRMHHVGFKFDRWLGTVLLQKSLPGAPVSSSASRRAE